MGTIVTSNLHKDDVPQGDFKWHTFSKFALTFDPLSEAKDEFNQEPVSAILSHTWSVLALRYFLYGWQRIGNNQGELSTDAIYKVQAALSILRSKI
jgi:hypothetical protein